MYESIDSKKAVRKGPNKPHIGPDIKVEGQLELTTACAVEKIAFSDNTWLSDANSSDPQLDPAIDPWSHFIGKQQVN